jgi:hypothetical protein
MMRVEMRVYRWTRRAGICSAYREEAVVHRVRMRSPKTMKDGEKGRY